MDRGGAERADRPLVALIRADQNPPGLEAALRERYRLRTIANGDPMADSLEDEASEVRVLVTGTMIGADRSMIEALTGLEVIACIGGHTDRIDLAAAREQAVRVCNTPGVSAGDVADMAIGLMIAVSRGLCEGDRFVREGSWRRRANPFTHRVNGVRLGIVGLGGIGRIVARRAAAFDMEIGYHGRTSRGDVPYRFFGDLRELAAHVDILSLHCTMTSDTRHLVDAEVLRALGPDGILINVARGAVVDERALIDALRTGVIAGAGLDVFENEPDVPPELIALPNVVLEAHHAAYTFEAKQAMADMILANLDAHFAGRPLLTELDTAEGRIESA
jgi:D-3-phosphoglycerate dehydrogenase